MTDLRKAANMALRALEFSYPLIEDYGNKEQLDIHHEAIMALHKALTQPEQKLIGWKDGEPQYVAQPEQEPIAYMGSAGLGYDKNKYLSIPLYTAPPIREWVGLTDEDINKSWEWAQKSSPYGVTRIETFAKSIEAKLKEKNDG